MDWMKAWKEVAEATSRAYTSGQLRGCLFHGTNGLGSEGLLRDGFKGKSYWAEPDVASIYARDKVIGAGAGSPTLVVIRVADLDQSHMWYDEGSIYDPVGRCYAQVREIWVDAGQWKGGWRASLAACGSIEYHGDAPPEMIVGTISDLADVERVSRLVETFRPGTNRPCAEVPLP